MALTFGGPCQHRQHDRSRYILAFLYSYTDSSTTSSMLGVRLCVHKLKARILLTCSAETCQHLSAAQARISRLPYKPLACLAQQHRPGLSILARPEHLYWPPAHTEAVLWQPQDRQPLDSPRGDSGRRSLYFLFKSRPERPKSWQFVVASKFTLCMYKKENKESKE